MEKESLEIDLHFSDVKERPSHLQPSPIEMVAQNSFYILEKKQ